MHKGLLLLLVFASQLAAPARAQELLGIDFVLGEVYRLDAKTGESTYVGYTGMDTYLWHSMAKDSSGRILAGYGRFDIPYGIYEINQHTGHASLVVQTSLINLMGLAFGPLDQLFAVHEPLNHSRPSEIYLVDLLSGATTLVGSTGFPAIQGLAFADGFLWGWDLSAGLVRIDPATGIAIDVNPGINSYGLSSPAQTLCVAENGALYGGEYALFTMDYATGALSFIDMIKPTYPFLCGMEFLPHQPAPFSLGVSGETGGPMGAFAAGATPTGQVAFLATRGGGGPTRILQGHACAGLELDLNQRLRLIGLATADAAGRAEIGPILTHSYPPGAIRMQAIDLRRCRTSNRIRVLY